MHHQMLPEHALECTEKGSATATESTGQRNTYREGKSACARQGVRQSEETRILNIPNLGSFSDKLLEGCHINGLLLIKQKCFEVLTIFLVFFAYFLVATVLNFEDSNVKVRSLSDFIVAVTEAFA